MIGASTSSLFQNPMFCVACTVCEASHLSCFRQLFRMVTKRSWDLRWTATTANTGFVYNHGRRQFWATSRKLILNGIHFLKQNQLTGNWPASSKSSTKTNLFLSSMKRRRKSWPMLWMLLTNQLKAALQSLTTAKVSSKLSSWVQKLRMASSCLVKAFQEA